MNFNPMSLLSMLGGGGENAPDMQKLASMLSSMQGGDASPLTDMIGGNGGNMGNILSLLKNLPGLGANGFGMSSSSRCGEDVNTAVFKLLGNKE